MAMKYRVLADRLREDLIRGSGQRGCKLPTELELTQQYQLSRQTVRHALQLLEEEGDLVRRILGTGHSLGVLAGGGEETEEQLERGRRAVERAARTRTTLAYVPAEQRAALEEKGWVCWEETLLQEPGTNTGAAAFANGVINRLGTRHRTVYLTLEGGEDAARVLPALLRQLNSSHYALSVPLETRL